MICGRPAFSNADVDRTAREVDIACGAAATALQGFPGETSADYVPCALGGNWDADVLLKTLNSERNLATAAFAEQQMPTGEKYARSYIGTLIHKAARLPGSGRFSSPAAASSTDRVESAGGHYTCFRKVGAVLYHLDSLHWASAHCPVSFEEAQRRIQEPGVNAWHVFRYTSPGSSPETQESEDTTSSSSESDFSQSGFTVSSSNRPNPSPIRQSARRAQVGAPSRDGDESSSSYSELPANWAPDNPPARAKRSRRRSTSRTNRGHAHDVAEPRKRLLRASTESHAIASCEPQEARNPAERSPKRLKTIDDALRAMGNVPLGEYSAADVTNLLRRLPPDLVRQALARGLPPSKPTTLQTGADRVAIPKNPPGRSTENVRSFQPGADFDRSRRGETANIGPAEKQAAGNDERPQTTGAPTPVMRKRKLRPAAPREPDVPTPKRSIAGSALSSARKTGTSGNSGSGRKSSQCSGGRYRLPRCIFSRTHPGQPARRLRGQLTCYWCSGWLTVGRLPTRSRGNYRKTFQSFSPSVTNFAVSRMHPRVRKFFEAPVPERASTQKRAPAPAPTPTRSATSLDCPGTPDEFQCYFSLTHAGEPAHLSRDARTCWWCSLAALSLPDSLDGQPSRPNPALESAIRHVFDNFESNVQRLARRQASATLRSIIDNTERKLCRGQRFDAPCEFSTIHPGCAVRVVRNPRCVCCRPDLARKLRTQRVFFRNIRGRIYQLLQPAYQSKLMQRVPADLRDAMAAARPAMPAPAPPTAQRPRSCPDETRRLQ